MRISDWSSDVCSSDLLVHFTGSDKVGAMIQAQAAPTLKRIVMELGGKSALIVRADADIAKAAAAGIMGFTTHGGQGCALTTRHLVHNSVRPQFVSAMQAMLAHMKIGNPADPPVHYGSLIRKVARSEERRVGKECVSTCRSRG